MKSASQTPDVLSSIRSLENIVAEAEKVISYLRQDSVARLSAMTPSLASGEDTYIVFGHRYEWSGHGRPAHALCIPPDGADNWAAEYDIGAEDFISRRQALKEMAAINGRYLKAWDEQLEEFDGNRIWALVFDLGTVQTNSFVCLERGCREISGDFHLTHTLKVVYPTRDEIAEFGGLPKAKVKAERKAVKRAK